VRRLGVAGAALLLFLTGAHAAYAKVTARLQVFPTQPRAGEVATIQLRTFALLEGTPPMAFSPDFPWSVGVKSPSWHTRTIAVARDAANPYLWSGTVRFSAPGVWEVCVLNFESGVRRGCTPANPRRVVVRVDARRAAVDAWHRLERPLRIPMIAAGAPCPTSAAHGDLSRIGFGGPAWGDGPAYPVLGSIERPLLRYVYPIPPSSTFFGSAWAGNKVLWAVEDVYRGPLLIRGLQLDGPNEVRFDDGLVPSREMRVSRPPGPAGRPSFTRVRAPGCYGYQVDGVGFGSVVVFEARPY
jgi:hypothetical protein